MGERQLDKLEVTGSSPVAPTFAQSARARYSGAERRPIEALLSGAATTHAEPGRAEEQRVFGGRFRALSCLKQDGEVATLLGTDLESGTDVVIKTAVAAAVPPGVQTRLEHEAEVLGSVSSPYLTPLIEVGRQDGLLYLAHSPLHRVTLIDFGLSRSSKLATPIRELPAGTAHYMSPERAGLLNREVDERADLYSPRTRTASEGRFGGRGGETDS